jgi:PAP2 superfamily
MHSYTAFNPILAARRLHAGVALLIGSACAASADVVIEWNATMNHYNESQPPPGAPPLEIRAYAMAHIAMFNAAAEAARAHANQEAAAAVAAHDVLAKTLPNGASIFDGLLAKQLGQMPDGSEKVIGLQIGAKAGGEMLAERSNDGAAQGEGPYTPGTKPGNYQFTKPFDVIAPPGGAPPYAHFPNLGRVTPFVLKSADQFRAPPPYSVRDPEYVFDFNEVKALGAKNSAARSADQTEIAQFWYEMAYFSWNRIARSLAAQQSDSLLDHARLFAALNAAMADGIIAGFESKYTFAFWRPLTAIHEAAGDDNNLTAADPAWEPLMLTPPMPEYVATHATMSAAASVVLIWFFHGDEHTFTITSTMVSAVPGLHERTYHRISDAAVECALSRVFAGVHFRSACLQGLAQGREVGAWVVQHAPYTDGR